MKYIFDFYVFFKIKVLKCKNEPLGSIFILNHLAKRLPKNLHFSHKKTLKISKIHEQNLKIFFFFWGYA